MIMPEKITMTNLNAVDENVKKIGNIFPNCITEFIDENGKPCRRIDFDILRQELSNSVVEGAQERYSFSWPNKKKAILLANAPTTNTLRPEIEKSVSFDETKNIFIEGDNLDVLKCLREAYFERVKMIYIDPPYNTGSDFVYEDDFKSSVEAYLKESGQTDEEGNRLFSNLNSDGRYHTNWLNMIYPRLKIARDLLSPDGVIFISIDDNEVANLRKVCDEIFGAMNLVAQIPWQSRASIQNDTDLSVNHEYICVYAKNRRQENRRLKEANKATWYSKDSFVCRPIPLDRDGFDNPDNDPRGPWKADPFDAPNVRENLTYEIVNPNTGDVYLPPPDRHWRVEKKKYEALLADNRIVFGTTGKSKPQLKVFYDEKKDLGSVDNTWFSADRIGTTTAATKALKSLFGNKTYFDTPKPTSLIKKLIYLANVHDGDIVLDFFAGSGSTAQAVMEFNVENNVAIKYLICQIPEKLDAKTKAFKDGYKTISEICLKRLRIANDKLYDSLTTSQAISGYRVFKLSNSNMNEVFYEPEKTDQASLFDLSDNVKQDRTAEDLLIQVMLSLGAPLDCSIEQVIFDTKQVFKVDNGFIMACFENEITEKVIEDIAKEQPRFVVLRDACFSSDSVADNFEQIFKMYAPNTECKVI